MLKTITHAEFIKNPTKIAEAIEFGYGFSVANENGRSFVILPEDVAHGLFETLHLQNIPGYSDELNKSATQKGEVIDWRKILQ